MPHGNTPGAMSSVCVCVRVCVVGFKELQERLNELYDSMSKETEK